MARDFSRSSFEEYQKFGSAFNHLSRTSKDSAEIVREKRPSHYDNNQYLFALKSQKAFINLCKSFSPKMMFDLNNTEISAKEILNIEEFYKFITNQRMIIYYSNNETDYTRVGIDHQYRPPKDVTITKTNLTPESIYDKYTRTTPRDSVKVLKLKDLTKNIGCDEEIDREILLGSLINKEGDIFHFMNEYKSNCHHFSKEKEEIMMQRIDNISALCLKKAILEEDDDKALDYALYFTILRGYNIRSVVGACWAQETSLRWILYNRQMIQFRKSPGVYLDIEATDCLEVESSEEVDNSGRIAVLVEKMGEDYCDSIFPGLISIGRKDSLFDKPNEVNIEEYRSYLVYSKEYSLEDIEDFFLDESTSQYHKKSLVFIAKYNKDSSFFKKIASFVKDNEELIKNTFKGIDISFLEEYISFEPIKELINIANSSEPSPSTLVIDNSSTLSTTKGRRK